MNIASVKGLARANARKTVRRLGRLGRHEHGHQSLFYSTSNSILLHLELYYNSAHDKLRCYWEVPWRPRNAPLG